LSRQEKKEKVGVGSCCEGGGRKVESLARRLTLLTRYRAAIINNKLSCTVCNRTDAVATEYQVISSPFFFFKKMSLPFPVATSSSSSFHQRAVQLWRVTIKFFEKGNASSFGCSVWRIYIASRRRRFRRAAAERATR
jgi:hypothetical protein